MLIRLPNGQLKIINRQSYKNEEEYNREIMQIKQQFANINIQPNIISKCVILHI